MYQHFPFQGLPKYIQRGIFGMKIYHLATLIQPTFFQNSRAKNKCGMHSSLIWRSRQQMATLSNVFLQMELQEKKSKIKLRKGQS
jgi:hypothetical protein